MRAQFFLSSRFAGTSDVPFEQFKEESAAPQSRAYYCSTCGDVFARMVVEGPTGWRYEPRRCARCGHSPGVVAGSILWLPHGSESFENLPPQVLKHEVERHWSYFLGD